MDRWRDSAHKNVNVKVVTGEERDQRIGIALQNAQKRQGHGDTRAAVQGLLDDAGAASVYQVASVIRRVSARQNEYLSIAQEERANTLIRHHSTVGLADRLVEHGLVERIRGEGDRRQFGSG